MKARQGQILSRQDAREFCIVAEESGGELVGFARGTRHIGGVLGLCRRVEQDLVLRRYHRQGLGKQLVCRIARLFVARGVTSMLLFETRPTPPTGSTRRARRRAAPQSYPRVSRRLRLADLNSSGLDALRRSDPATHALPSRSAKPQGD